jgi:hypothetical protein
MCVDGGITGGSAMRIAADDQSGEGDSDNVANVMRVTDDLAERIGKWSGVDACCDKTFAMGQLRPHFDAWVAETVARNPGKVLVASGWFEGEIKCESARHPFGRKKCKGWFTKIGVYADFAPAA